MAGTKISDATLTTPVATDMIPFERVADATARRMTHATLTTLLCNQALVFNESGADVDFRFEASGETHALFIQGSDGFVGIGVAAPTVRLDVAGSVAFDGGAIFNESGADVDFRVEAVARPTALFIDGTNGMVGIGLTPTANMWGLSIETGLLTLKERAIPVADADYGKIWTESDNTLHFQDGAGTEYTIDITPV